MKLRALFVFYAVNSKPLATVNIITINNEVGHEKSGHRGDRCILNVTLIVEKGKLIVNIDGWLTVHLSITLV